ncbi:hypothetical protein BIV57_21830 [Mangrovactinospora gilvigrisea]|uniref:ESAT-6-like protein n=1 Tax=Mangrovactinospora gilvigrisea TaxID=1428644 RepID=A0A1J7B9P3_9ACTN|nr:WXG100 family type VII secretion target [Mangrovactinospora gilvigrisea]OIV35371.1 hypothetical protein BIV57_21830 [Mangrovactinospora gilvigrisea]
MSGTDGILVNFHTVSGAAVDCRTTAMRIAEKLGTLRGAVAHATAHWEGEAEQGYHHRQDEWDRAAADLNQVLMRIAGALDAAGQQYACTESRNTAMWM